VAGFAVVSLQDLRRDEARMRLLRYLSDHPDATTRQIAGDLGVSNGAAYYLLKELLDKGLVKVRRFANSKSKAQYLYVLTSEGFSQKFALTLSFLDRKRQEYQALEAEIQAMEQELYYLDDFAPETVSDT
jgi:EPS-associated MarR family transcriptional regulator